MTVLDEDTEFLEHFGVKGQKWGVRRGKGKTGVSRMRGARIDRNERQISNLGKAKDGTKYKVSNAIVNTIAGKEVRQKALDNKMKELRAQNKRLKSGEVHVADRLAAFGSATLFDLMVSRKPA